MKIVVIGTGLIGSKTVAILLRGGEEVVAASPQSGIDSITGEGLKEAMVGAQVAIDLANSPSVVPCHSAASSQVRRSRTMPM
jgi:nucleoside-diphosphate-sugar epimerase